MATSSKFQQNQLPSNVDYKNMGKNRVTVIGKGVEEEMKLNMPSNCAYDVSEDKIYVTDLKNKRVMVYDGDGRNGKMFYSNVTKPLDVAVSTDGQFVYIAAKIGLIKLDAQGRHVKTIKSFSKASELNECASVVCHHGFTVVLMNTKRQLDAQKYVDSQKYVVIFDQEDREIRCFGRGHGVSQISRYLAVSEEGKIYVTETATSCVQVFAWEGDLLETFGATGEYNNISGIAVDKDDNVCVVRFNSGHIDVYNAKRELIATIGSRGRDLGQLFGPLGLCLCPDGRLIVADTYNNRLQIF